MKKVLRKFCYWLASMSAHYRLTVYYHGTAMPEHTYSRRVSVLRRKIAHLHGTACWMLYCKGPLGLPEREIDFGTYRAD